MKNGLGNYLPNTSRSNAKKAGYFLLAGDPDTISFLDPFGSTGTDLKDLADAKDVSDEVLAKPA